MLDNSKKPMVSIIMPAYNSEKYIADSINSVLSQTYKNYRLIIVDDFSTDNTLSVINAFAQKNKNIKVISNKKNSGVAASRNYGVSIAEGEYIAFLDSDDIWHKDKLEKQIKLAAKSDADIIYSSYSIFSSQSLKSKNFIVKPCTSFKDNLSCNMFGCSTVMVKSDIMKKHKFNSEYYHEDYVLWLELLKCGCKACGCTEVLADYRLVSGSRSENKLNSAAQRWRIYREYLKMPVYKSFWYFVKYMVNGIIKYC